MEHDGRFPDSFEVLVEAYEGDLLPAVFIAPRGSETAADNFEQMFGEPGHISFVWSGSGLTMDNICEESVLAYQSRPTRSDGRIWVAYADGTTRHLAPVELHSRLRAAADIVGGELSRLNDVECALIAPRADAASPE
jgi:hypothetical protein